MKASLATLATFRKVIYILSYFFQYFFSFSASSLPSSSKMSIRKTAAKLNDYLMKIKEVLLNSFTFIQSFRLEPRGAAELALVAHSGHGVGVPDEAGLDVVLGVAGDEAVAHDVGTGVTADPDRVVLVLVPVE